MSATEINIKNILLPIGGAVGTNFVSKKIGQFAILYY